MNIVIILILVVLLIVSIRKNIQCIEQLITIQIQIEKSLDILDVCYKRAAIKAQLEVMSDEPVVRELVNDIKTSRDAILLVAKMIVSPFAEEDEGSDE